MTVGTRYHGPAGRCPPLRACAGPRAGRGDGKRPSVRVGPGREGQGVCVSPPAAPALGIAAPWPPGRASPPGRGRLESRALCCPQSWSKKLPLVSLVCPTSGWCPRCRQCWPPGRGSPSSSPAATWSQTGKVSSQVGSANTRAEGFPAPKVSHFSGSQVLILCHALEYVTAWWQNQCTLIGALLLLLATAQLRRTEGRVGNAREQETEPDLQLRRR